MNQEDEETETCGLCLLQYSDHPGLLANALYNKYTTMTEYGSFYDLLCIIKNTSSRINNLFKDQLFMDDEREHLSKYYPQTRLKGKIKEMLKYYRYHVALPTCHLGDIGKIIHRRQNLQLKRYYRGIKRQLNMTVETSRTEESSQDTPTHQSLPPACTCILCNLNLTRDEQMLKDFSKPSSRRVLIKSESNALKDILLEMSSKKIEKQCYLKEEFMKREADSRITHQFENYLSLVEKKPNAKAHMNSEKRMFLKKNLIGAKDIHEILKQSSILKPKFTFVRRQLKQSSPPQTDNFLNNFVSNPNPYSEQPPSGRIYRKQLKERFKISLRPHKQSPRISKPTTTNIFSQKYKQYMTDLPKIDSNKSIKFRKITLNNRADSSPDTDLRHGSLGRASMNFPRESSGSLAKVKTQQRAMSKQKAMSLERMRKTLPTESIIPKKKQARPQAAKKQTITFQPQQKPRGQPVLQRRQNYHTVKNLIKK